MVVGWGVQHVCVATHPTHLILTNYLLISRSAAVEAEGQMERWQLVASRAWGPLGPLRTGASGWGEGGVPGAPGATGALWWVATRR